MSSTCEFIFDRPEPIYYGNETINGRIRLNTTKEKSFRELYIQFIGEAKTRWGVHRLVHIRMKRMHFTVYYQGQETYIHSHKTLEKEGVLSSGTHEYSFNIELPPEIPSSCEEAYGHIRYEICLVIDRTVRFNNIFRQPVTVLRQFNLNTFPELLLPIRGEDHISFCCWPCRSGPVKAILTLPLGGYAPGQDINFALHIKNSSRLYDVKNIKLRLVQTYTFLSRTPRMKKRKHSVKLTKTKLNEIVRRSSESVIKGSLRVPAVPPTTYGDFIVSVAYHIEMVFGATCRSYSKIKIPITIGTVPLLQTDGGSTPEAPIEYPSKYHIIKPPSYEEAKSITTRFVDIDVDEHSRFKSFVPKYPMYVETTLSTTQEHVEN